MLLIAIGESLKNLDKTTDGLLLPTYPSIPWKNVKGLRDIIAHHYFPMDGTRETDACRPTQAAGSAMAEAESQTFGDCEE